ncbi:hypothetical protein QA584_17430 [Anaerocolumna sp. AGMB13025]|uniref:hypothetical protein n=1 Tax=Anaerocolumna sp. AGMB13025 TaxID=3039116 RepID=UPI00241E7F6A|nr:hypothetical protein [Anaerocolumna sp. AGMB13025]WFR55383.1 hypothetical protein QA584_17430 [Anaerocolumna sp. AGMB13025]
MNRIQLLILSILESNKALSRYNGMTVNEIITLEEFGYKGNTYYKYLKEFENKGYVSPGVKEGNAMTFYITPQGLEALKEEKSG